MRNRIPAALAALLFLGAGQHDSSLAWLEGTWCTEPGVRPQTCENWRPMSGGVMHGTTETRHGRMTQIEETMRITADGADFVFHAEPRGQAPADFHSVQTGPLAIAFENRAHDYPQRVRYWREGDVLNAEISRADGSRPMRWTYRRAHG